MTTRAAYLTEKRKEMQRLVARLRGYDYIRVEPMPGGDAKTLLSVKPEWRLRGLRMCQYLANIGERTHSPVFLTLHDFHLVVKMIVKDEDLDGVVGATRTTVRYEEEKRPYK